MIDRDAKTPGQLAYEADVTGRPRYHDGTRRKMWSELDQLCRWSWERGSAPVPPPSEIPRLRALGTV